MTCVCNTVTSEALLSAFIFNAEILLRFGFGDENNPLAAFERPDLPYISMICREREREKNT